MAIYVLNAVSSASFLFFRGCGDVGRGVCGEPTCHREQTGKSCGNMGM